MKLHKISIASSSMFAIASAAAWAAGSEFEGIWKVQDNAGQAYEIALSADGTARGTQEAGQKGSWKSDGNAAVIEWSSGWVTKISKNGDQFVKTAMKKGGAPGQPTPAEKVSGGTMATEGK